MSEVDVDGSDSIDFFEYITVANMLMDKRGNMFNGIINLKK